MFPIKERQRFRLSAREGSPEPTSPADKSPAKSKISASLVFIGYAKRRRCSRLIRSSKPLGVF